MRLSLMSLVLARGRALPLDTFFAAASELGLQGIDWVTTHGIDPHAIRRRSDDSGIPAICYTCFLPCLADPQHVTDGVEQFKRVLETAQVLGAPQIMIPPTGNGLDRDLRRTMWVDGLGRILPLAADAGMTVSVENVPGAASPMVTSDDYLAMHSELPELGLTLDNGNLATGGDTAIRALRRRYSRYSIVNTYPAELCPHGKDLPRPGSPLIQASR